MLRMGSKHELITQICKNANDTIINTASLQLRLRLMLYHLPADHCRSSGQVSADRLAAVSQRQAGIENLSFLQLAANTTFPSSSSIMCSRGVSCAGFILHDWAWQLYWIDDTWAHTSKTPTNIFGVLPPGACAVFDAASSLVVQYLR